MHTLWRYWIERRANVDVSFIRSCVEVLSAAWMFGKAPFCHLAAESVVTSLNWSYTRQFYCTKSEYAPIYQLVNDWSTWDGGLIHNKIGFFSVTAWSRNVVDPFCFSSVWGPLQYLPFVSVTIHPKAAAAAARRQTQSGKFHHPPAVIRRPVANSWANELKLGFFFHSGFIYGLLGAN